MNGEQEGIRFDIHHNDYWSLITGWQGFTTGCCHFCKMIKSEPRFDRWYQIRTKLNEFLKAPPEDFLDCYPVDPKLLNSGLVDTSECVVNTEAVYSHLLKAPAV